jgi:hypothetical protein
MMRTHASFVRMIRSGVILAAVQAHFSSRRGGRRRAGITREGAFAMGGKNSVMGNVIRDAAVARHANLAAVEVPELAQSASAAVESLAALIHQLADLPIVPQSRFHSVLIDKLDHWREVVERPAASGAAKAEDLKKVADELKSLIERLPHLKDGLLPEA